MRVGEGDSSCPLYRPFPRGRARSHATWIPACGHTGTKTDCMQADGVVAKAYILWSRQATFPFSTCTMGLQHSPGGPEANTSGPASRPAQAADAESVICLRRQSGQVSQLNPGIRHRRSDSAVTMRAWPQRNLARGQPNALPPTPRHPGRRPLAWHRQSLRLLPVGPP